jgi:hypothetical protein
VRALFSKIDQQAAADVAAAQPPPAAAGPGGAPADGKLTLCVQLAADVRLKVRIAPGDPMSKLFTTVQQHMLKKGAMREGQAVRFIFDGDVLRGGQTPEELDMEGDELVEVQVS